MTKDYKISDIKYAGYSDSVYTKVPHQLYKSEEDVDKEIVAPTPATSSSSKSENSSSEKSETSQSSESRSSDSK